MSARNFCFRAIFLSCSLTANDQSWKTSRNLYFLRRGYKESLILSWSLQEKLSTDTGNYTDVLEGIYKVPGNNRLRFYVHDRVGDM